MPRPFHIALAFPELGRETLASFEAGLARAAAKPDLILFPEAFETVPWAGVLLAGPQGPLPPPLEELAARYQAFADRHDAAVHVGFQASLGPTAKLQPAKWTGFDQFGLLFLPDGRPPVLYHKHTTSARVGWNDPGWSPERNLPVVPFRGERIGFTSCHDLALSPLARALKAQEATVWVNPSGDNTRDYLWGDLLQARVAENGFKAGVCALHRDSHRSNPQRAPHAYAPGGAIALRDLGTGAPLESIPAAERTGRFFYFDASSPSVLPRARDGELFTGQAVHREARFDLASGLRSPRREYGVHAVSLEDFLHRPERLWAAAEAADPDRVPVFRVAVRDRAEWEARRPEVEKVVRGRCVEFSTLFAVADGKTVHLAAHRSSNYKDTRVLAAPGPAFALDDRYLFGPRATIETVRGDPRADHAQTAFHRRLGELVAFAGRMERPAARPGKISGISGKGRRE